MADAKAPPPKNKGGRPKGSVNRSSREMLELARKSGPTPLEIMLGVARARFKDGQFDSALDAAGKAAPYLHPKLATTQVTGVGGGPLSFYDLSKMKDMSDDELANLARLAEKLAATGSNPGGDSEEEGGEGSGESS